MPHLFEPLALCSVTLPNRIVVSPMCQYSAVDGLATDWHHVHLGRYATAGLGLIFTEATHVSAVGRITPACLGLYTDAHEAALARIVRLIKATGNAAVGIQIAHAGRKASMQPPWKGVGKRAEGAEGWISVGPSAVAFDDGWQIPRALDEAGMATIVREFAIAATRSARAGFDVCEVHSAHGYLMHEFLSPISNKRNDAYGGALENRMRFPLGIVEAVRAVWPKDRVLAVRVSATDYMDGEGWSLDDTIAFAHELKARGVDIIDVSGGGSSPKQKIDLKPGYQVPLAEAIKRATGVPTIAVGLITRPEQADAIVREGRADAVALARALLHDPFWAWRAADALGADVAVPNQYLRGRKLAV
ncbi:MAG: NADH:flavin oxidoreductase/NADH oxidase [Alphaproteobacteria bacterium]|nr:NADH:flavin oxidoreductase/NADH oxidase [Alphaproteobacteria bacterium]